MNRSSRVWGPCESGRNSRHSSFHVAFFLRVLTRSARNIYAVQADGIACAARRSTLIETRINEAVAFWKTPARSPFLPTLLSQNSSDRAEIQLYRGPYFPQGRAPIPQSKDPVDRSLRDSRRHRKVAQNGQYVMNGRGGNSQPFSDLPQSEAFAAHGNDLIVSAIVARPPAYKKHAALG